MKITMRAYGIALALTSSLTATATVNAIAISGNDLFVVNESNGNIGEYTTSGKTVNAELFSDLGEPDGIAIRSGSNVFPVPERSTVVMAALGLGVAAFWLRRRAE